MKGSNTAEVIRLVAMACCVRLVGSGARAENCRTAECPKLDLMTVARVILEELEEGSCVGSRILQIIGGRDPFMSQCWSLPMTYGYSLIGGTYWFSFSARRRLQEITKAERCQCSCVLVNLKSKHWSLKWMDPKTIICKIHQMVVNQVLGRKRPEYGPGIAL